MSRKNFVWWVGLTVRGSAKDPAIVRISEGLESDKSEAVRELDIPGIFMREKKTLRKEVTFDFKNLQISVRPLSLESPAFVVSDLAVAKCNSAVEFSVQNRHGKVLQKGRRYEKAKNWLSTKLEESLDGCEAYEEACRLEVRSEIEAKKKAAKAKAEQERVQREEAEKRAQREKELALVQKENERNQKRAEEREKRAEERRKKQQALEQMRAERRAGEAECQKLVSRKRKELVQEFKSRFSTSVESAVRHSIRWDGQPELVKDNSDRFQIKGSFIYTNRYGAKLQKCFQQEPVCARRDGVLSVEVVGPFFDVPGGLVNGPSRIGDVPCSAAR